MMKFLEQGCGFNLPFIYLLEKYKVIDGKLEAVSITSSIIIYIYIYIYYNLVNLLIHIVLNDIYLNFM